MNVHRIFLSSEVADHVIRSGEARIVVVGVTHNASIICQPEDEEMVKALFPNAKRLGKLAYGNVEYMVDQKPDDVQAILKKHKPEK